MLRFELAEWDEAEWDEEVDAMLASPEHAWVVGELQRIPVRRTRVRQAWAMLAARLPQLGR